MTQEFEAREQGRPGAIVNGGEQTDLLAAMPPGTVDLLGQETTQAIAARLDRLADLEGLSRQLNPFSARPSDEIDLSCLKPDLAHTVEEFRHGRWVQPGKPDLGIFAGKSAFEKAKVRLTLGELTIAASGVQAHLSDATKESRLALTIVDSELSHVIAGHESGNPLDVNWIRLLAEDLEKAAVRLPSRPAMNGLGATLETAIAPSRYGSRLLRAHANPFSVSGRLLHAVAKVGNEKAYKWLKAAHNKKELESEIGQAREEGTSLHRALIDTVKAEEVRDAVQLLREVVAAKERLPQPDQLDQDKINTSLAVEDYLVAQANKARSIIQRLHPSRFGEEAVHMVMRQARTKDFAGALATKRALDAEAARNDAESQAPAHMSIARDVLQGGRRLSPSSGQTEITQKALALDEMLNSYTDKKALSRSECGIVVALYTGAYGKFETAWTEAQALENTIIATMSAQKREPLTELKEFKLDEALRKISAFLSRPPHQQGVAEILGSDDDMRQLHKTVKKILKQREHESRQGQSD